MGKRYAVHMLLCEVVEQPTQPGEKALHGIIPVAVGSQIEEFGIVPPFRLENWRPIYTGGSPMRVGLFTRDMLKGATFEGSVPP